ncbi:hypothetical protein [Bacillus cereus group sp. BfR-BA-01380]|uniref:hypothetical protein n=1 Tax=Bacillus cereus group sp. BfR-BA-01380 TaxID=2920324 RepID=UPI001F587524|nr:hypothetical protein [Bacillus cereus group sp. BfR-BA-01380]
MINYNGRKFILIENTDNGGVSTQTLFEYKQEGNIISASYSEGEIIQETLVAIVKEDSSLEFRYNRVNTKNEMNGLFPSETVVQFNLFPPVMIRK